MSKILKRAAGFLLALGLVTVVYADPIITGSIPFTFVPGTIISSSQVNANNQYIINQVNTNAAKNAANSSITSLLGLTTPIAPGFGGSSTYIATTVGGTANAITVTATQPAISSYTLSNRNIVVFKATGQNTGPATLDVNSTGATNIVKQTTNGLIALQNGDILVNNVYHVFYDGTNYILTNNPQLFGQEATFASAATVDLGLAQSHNVQISGTATITSFGSSATLNNPTYLVKFGGALTVTQGGDLVLPGLTNYATTAGDAMLVEFIGGTGWRVRAIWPRNIQTPTVQRFTSGTAATYTPPANLRYIKVTMAGGGGGGGASITNSGSNGTTSSFGSWTAILGNGGAPAGGAGGVGGTGGTNGTGTLVARFDGDNGDPAGNQGGLIGGNGGSNVFSGGAVGGTTTGGNGRANSGGGGAGAGAAGGATDGAGGGAGEYVQFYMTIAQIGASQTYTVGTGGTGAPAGGAAGGNGAAGLITVEEFYE